MLEAYNYRQCVDEVNQEQMSTVTLRPVYTSPTSFCVCSSFCSSLLQFASNSAVCFGSCSISQESHDISMCFIIRNTSKRIIMLAIAS